MVARAGLIAGEMEEAGALASCSRFAFSHAAMACVWEVCLVADSGRYAEHAACAVFEEVDRIESELSRFIPTSDVARINALRDGQRTLVGIDTLDCLDLAARIADETGGAFDVTYLRTIADATPAGGHLHADRASHCVFATGGPVSIDLGGIGKGYAVDRAAAILRDWDVHDAMIHAGQSTVLAIGRPPSGEGWTVAIRNPDDPEADVGQVVLCDAALSGSGVRIHGRHIIDPRSGRRSGRWVGAWALDRSAAVSDALATAFMLMSAEQIAACCDRGAGRGAGVLASGGGGEGELLRFGALAGAGWAVPTA